MKTTDVSQLKTLGSKGTEYDFSGPSREILETFENVHPNNNYKIHLIFPEFTSLCPKTHQPDFAEITVDYMPNARCIESKSLKLYYFAYRNCGAFMEEITNRMLNDFVAVTSPKWMKVTGKFNARGGTEIIVEAEYTENVK
jgi:7-cyano-7-deazaguanine reductase